MSNNQSIQILRGTRSTISSADNSSTKLLAGQPLYNMTNNYLTIGDGTKFINALPIVVREVHGYSADNSGLVASVTNGTNDWKFGCESNNGADKVVLDVNGLPLEISTDTTNNLVISQDSNSITINTSTSGNKSKGTVTITTLNNTDTSSTSNVTVSGNTVTAENFEGLASRTTKLNTARTINGTSFDGTNSITTERWGSSRTISISSSDGSGAGTEVSVNGSSNVTLKLPSNIKASLTGTADKALTSEKVKISSSDYTLELSSGTPGSNANTIYFVY